MKYLHKRGTFISVVHKIKTMKKTKVSQYISAKFSVGLLAVSSAVLIGGSFIPPFSNIALADTYTDQINSLSAQNADARNAVGSLQTQAATYQESINQLQTQINALQAAIDANTAQQAALQQQIADAQAQIDQQRAFLATDIKAMYVDGTPSTLEVLATSKNLSEFVDKQEYRTSVQNKLQDTLKKIAELQHSLSIKKAAVEQLLNEQHAQQTQVAADESKVQQLLSYNEGQQAAYNSQLVANNAKIAQLQAIERAMYAKATGSNGTSPVGYPVKYKNFTTSYSKCGGGYSYCWAGFDQSVSDPWGLGYAHECVHYVADKLTRMGKHIPDMSSGGNANQWANYGTVVGDPQPGDVAYMPMPGVGHVGVVEGINGDGTVHVSQMNWPYGGYYSELDLYVTPGVQFIRFY